MGPTIKPAPSQADPNTGSWSLPGISRFTATHVSLALLLQLAYGVDNSQIANKPDWLETNLYDVVGFLGTIGPLFGAATRCKKRTNACAAEYRRR